MERGGHMVQNSILEKVRSAFEEIVISNSMMQEEVSVKAKVLSVQDAIGNPLRQDYPLVKGNEKLMQAEFKGAIGQAFTDMPGNFEGKIHEIIDLSFDSNFNRAIFVATVNAIINYLDMGKNMIHCKDEEPEDCGRELAENIKKRFGSPRITLIGYQPAFLENLSANFTVRVLDLDEEKIGTEKYGVLIEDGEAILQDALSWCDVIVATGSTIVNNTIDNYVISSKPTIFYGTTIAGAASILGLERHCKYSK